MLLENSQETVVDAGDVQEEQVVDVEHEQKVCLGGRERIQ